MDEFELREEYWWRGGSGCKSVKFPRWEGNDAILLARYLCKVEYHAKCPFSIIVKKFVFLIFFFKLLFANNAEYKL